METGQSVRCVLAGATGLVGGELLNLLIADERVDQIVTLGRRGCGRRDAKLTDLKVDFDTLFDKSFGEFDAAYCCLGTTIKNAGSQAAFKQVDHDYVLQFADLAKRSGVRKFLVVSALGADASSYFFYNRVKGEVENDLRRLRFDSLVIFRPSLLLGERKEKRLAEQLAVKLYPLYRPLLVGKLARQTPIHAEDVARSMLEKTFEDTGKTELVLNHQMLGLQ